MVNNQDPLKHNDEIQGPEQTFLSLIEHSPHMMFINQKGKVIYVNQKCVELLGYRRTELYSPEFDFLTLIAPESRVATSVNYANHIKGEATGPYECTLLTRNGTHIKSMINPTLFRYHGELAILGIITDIDERNQIERALVKARNELEIRVKERTGELEEANAELKLRASLLDKATDAILLRDTGHRLVYVNEAACKMYGYDKSEFIGKDFKSILTPEELPYFDERTKTVFEKGEVRVEAYQLRKDKSVFPSESDAHLIQIGERQYILSVVRDITQRWLAETALRESEERFRSIYQSSPIGIELYDPEGQLIMANQACLDIFGIDDVSEVKGFKLFEDPNVTSEIKDKLKGFEKVRYEAPFDFEKVKEARLYPTSKSGIIQLDVVITPITYQRNGIPGGYLVQVQDITEHNLAEEKIRQSEIQFQKLFDSLNEGVSLITPDGRVIKSNPANSRILGLDPTEIENHQYKIPHLKHIFPDGREMPLEELATYKAIKLKSHARNPEVGIIRKDGSTIWLDVSSVPIIDDSGQITGVVRTLADITEQKSLREERENFTKQLIRVQEEERKRIARDLHDDAAQNLALMVLEIDSLLHSGQKMPAKSMEKLEKLREDAERTQKEVRRYSHELRPGTLEHLGLEAALEGLTQEANVRGGTRVSLDIYGKEKPLAEEVELAFFRIAQEAVNNVFKHSGATKAQIILKYAPKKIGLTIDDNGKGFKQSKKEQAGQPGGLGLVGMRERAQIIGANLMIKSTPGKGTAISIEVPVPGDGNAY